ncbi:MAG: hypothetical protein ACRDJB_14240 [Actinomycetota bacterium]
MKRTLSTAMIVVALALPLGGVAGATPSGSTPPQNGCPASATPTAVADLVGYLLPGILDASGNNDGMICAFPLPQAVAKNAPVETVYQFFENNLPAAEL